MAAPHFAVYASDAQPTTLSSSGDDWRYYAYEPSKVLPIVCAALFFALFLAQVVLIRMHKAKFMIPFAIGVLGEALGYAFRRVSVNHPTGRGQGLTWYIIQELCIILSPALMAASHYMAFGRLIRWVGEKYSPVRASRVTIIFVTFDVLSFVVQGAGGSLYSSDNTSLYNVAKVILEIGFIIQIVSFGIFAIFASIYQVRARRAGHSEGHWTVCLYTLYSGCVLILIRSIFRTVEYGTGQSGQGGYLESHEAFYYGLETLPIFLCTVLFIPLFPGRFIPTDREERLIPKNAAYSDLPPSSATTEAEKLSV